MKCLISIVLLTLLCCDRLPHQKMEELNKRLDRLENANGALYAPLLYQEIQARHHKIQRLIGIHRENYFKNPEALTIQIDSAIQLIDYSIYKTCKIKDSLRPETETWFHAQQAEIQKTLNQLLIQKKIDSSETKKKQGRLLDLLELIPADPINAKNETEKILLELKQRL